MFGAMGATVQLEGSDGKLNSAVDGKSVESRTADRVVSDGVELQVKNTLAGRTSDMDAALALAADVGNVDKTTQRDVVFSQVGLSFTPWTFKVFVTEFAASVEALSRQDQMEVVRRLLHHTYLQLPDIKNAFPGIEWNAELAHYLIQPGSFWSIYLYPQEFGVLPVEVFLKLLQYKGHESLYAVRRYGKLSAEDQGVFDAALKEASDLKTHTVKGTLSQEAAQ